MSKMVFVINNIFTFSCDHCGYIARFNVNKKIINTQLVCRNCLTRHDIQLCFRKYARKECSIDGYITINQSPVKYIINIENISLHGYKFKFFNNNRITIDDVVMINYQLPNEKKDVIITEEIKIVHQDTDTHYYGSVVTNPVDYSHNIKEKGFWLMGVNVDGL